MRFQRIHEAIHFQPWFISAAGYASVKAVFEKVTARNEDLDKFLADFTRQRPAMSIDKEGIATIHIFGVLGRHLSNIEKACGNTGYEEIESELAAAERAGARGILAIFDSPGGSVIGCDEAAQALADTASRIPVVGFCDTMSCSASYYVMAGCTSIVSTSSAMVGNIGVIIPWIDQSKMWETEGLRFDPITSAGADLKDTFHGPSISDEQRAFLQASVEEHGGAFRDHVSNHRLIDDEVWRAGWYSGKRALEFGLIDKVGNLPAALAELSAAM